MLALLAVVTLVHAQESPCDASFDINRLIDGMNKVDASFDAFDAENARVILQAIRADIPCLRDPIHTNHLVRLSRQFATAAFFDQDELEMGYWAQLAGVDPDMPWPASVTPDHPVRDQLTFVLMEDPLTVDGVLTPPKGGGILLDGTLLLEPTTTPDAPHFVQVVDKNVTVLSSRWQDGVVFPSALLAKVGEPPTAIRNYTPPDPNLDPTQTVTIDAAELARRQDSLGARLAGVGLCPGVGFGPGRERAHQSQPGQAASPQVGSALVFRRVRTPLDPAVESRRRLDVGGQPRRELPSVVGRWRDRNGAFAPRACADGPATRETCRPRRRRSLRFRTRTARVGADLTCR